MDAKGYFEQEQAHKEGKLFKICKKCGLPYRPELKKYKKKTNHLKETPEIKIQKSGKMKADIYESEDMVSGMWMLSKYCPLCIREGALKRK